MLPVVLSTFLKRGDKSEKVKFLLSIAFTDCFALFLINSLTPLKER